MALPREAGRGKGMAGKGDEQPRRGAVMRYPATAEKGDEMICSGTVMLSDDLSRDAKAKKSNCNAKKFIYACFAC